MSKKNIYYIILMILLIITTLLYDRLGSLSVLFGYFIGLSMSITRTLPKNKNIQKIKTKTCKCGSGETNFHWKVGCKDCS